MPNLKLEEIIKRIDKERGTIYQPVGGLTNVECFNKETVKQFIRQACLEYSKDIIENMKKYWFYAGRWHNAECAFILSDEGVCNCKHKQILDNINKDKSI